MQFVREGWQLVREFFCGEILWYDKCRSERQKFLCKYLPKGNS